MTSMIPAGDFKTTYAADTTIFPTVTSRNLVILGGLDSVLGAVLGGLIVGVLENVAQYVDSEFLQWGNMYTIAPFYALILILLIKPYGLFGTRNIERV